MQCAGLTPFSNWTQQIDTNSPNDYSFNYDKDNQLLSATLNSAATGAVLKQYAYVYDLAGNRTSEQISTLTNSPVALSQSFYNGNNQMTNRVSNSGPLMFAGNVNKQATVTVAGNAATFNHSTFNFVGSAGVSGGTNVVPVVATDYNNISTTNKYQLVVTNNGVAETISYDLDGNETSVVTAASTNTYQWDAANRLVQITQISTNGLQLSSQFVYDGLGRRVQDIESQNGVAMSTNKFLWDGQTMVEQRDSAGASVVKRFLGEGEQIAGVNYYFTRDHLGSVREMTDSSGAIHARYDYDPYGRQTKVSGDMNADFGFTGFYYHAVSGLNLALYREYNADLGRWLSRDPSGESSSLNLYAYCENNPIVGIDLLGLVNWGLLGSSVVSLVANAAITVGGTLLAETGVGAVAAVYGGYGVGTSALNIYSALHDSQAIATTPIKGLVEKYLPNNRTANNAAALADLVIPLVTGNLASVGDEELSQAAGLLTAAQYDSADLQFAEQWGALYQTMMELDMGINADEDINSLLSEYLNPCGNY